MYSLGVMPGKPRNSLDAETLFECRHANKILPVGGLSTLSGESDQLRYVLDGTVLQTNTIDYNILKRWLQDCQNNHLLCSRPESKAPHDLKVVDCKSRLIIPCRQDRKLDYLALSYVWGSQQSLNQVCQAGDSMLPASPSNNRRCHACCAKPRLPVFMG